MTNPNWWDVEPFCAMEDPGALKVIKNLSSILKKYAKKQ